MPIFMALASLFSLLSCQPSDTRESEHTANDAPWEEPWDSIVRKARGSTVQMMMWTGDPLINSFMNGNVSSILQKEYGIRLEIASGQGNQIVNHLIAEKEAGSTASAMDIVWINGETFYQLRQIDALAGPFLEHLPNARYLDLDNPFISRDFQQDINGMECPWGNVQLAFIYDTIRTPAPPESFTALESWVRQNPGRFTIPLEFTGMTVLKSWMMSLADDPAVFYGPFQEETYLRYSDSLWEKLNALKPYFWKKGVSFPESLAIMHQMFASGEIDITFSNNDAEVDNKMITGLFPGTSKAYFPEPGTIQNSHYLGLVKGGQNPYGALTVLNLLIEPELQYYKRDPGAWGDGPVLQIDSLPNPWPERFRTQLNRSGTPQRIPGRAFMEPAPEYMIRLYRDFREKVTDAR